MRNPELSKLLGRAYDALNLTEHREAVRYADCDCNNRGAKAALEAAMPHFLPGNEDVAEAIRAFIRENNCP